MYSNNFDNDYFYDMNYKYIVCNVDLRPLLFLLLLRPSLREVIALTPREVKEIFVPFSDNGGSRGLTRLNTILLLNFHMIQRLIKHSCHRWYGYGTVLPNRQQLIIWCESTWIETSRG